MEKNSFKSKGFIIAFVLLNLFIGNIIIAQNKSTNNEKVLLQHNNNIRVVEEFNEGNYVVRIIENQDKTFGYDIILRGKLIVHQPNKAFYNIPKGFINRENAIKFSRFHTTIIDSNKSNEELIKFDNINKLNLTSEDLSNQ